MVVLRLDANHSPCPPDTKEAEPFRAQSRTEWLELPWGILSNMLARMRGPLGLEANSQVGLRVTPA